MNVRTKEKECHKKTSPESRGHACVDCGAPAEYFVDEFGIDRGVIRCSKCHEQACRRNIRQDYWLRYGTK